MLEAINEQFNKMTEDEFVQNVIQYSTIYQPTKQHKHSVRDYIQHCLQHTYPDKGIYVLPDDLDILIGFIMYKHKNNAKKYKIATDDNNYDIILKNQDEKQNKIIIDKDGTKYIINITDIDATLLLWLECLVKEYNYYCLWYDDNQQIYLTAYVDDISVLFGGCIPIEYNTYMLEFMGVQIDVQITHHNESDICTFNSGNLQHYIGEYDTKHWNTVYKQFKQVIENVEEYDEYHGKFIEYIANNVKWIGYETRSQHGRYLISSSGIVDITGSPQSIEDGAYAYLVHPNIDYYAKLHKQLYVCK